MNAVRQFLEIENRFESYGLRNDLNRNIGRVIGSGKFTDLFRVIDDDTEVVGLAHGEVVGNRGRVLFRVNGVSGKCEGARGENRVAGGNPAVRGDNPGGFNAALEVFTVVFERELNFVRVAFFDIVTTHTLER